MKRDVDREVHGILRLRSGRQAPFASLPMNLPRLIEHDDAGGIVRDERPRRSVALQSCAFSMQPSSHSSGEPCYGHRVQFIPPEKSRPRDATVTMTAIWEVDQKVKWSAAKQRRRPTATPAGGSHRSGGATI